MLAQMAGQTKSSQTVDDAEPSELFSTPQLKPSPDMENVLSNILGANSSKQYNPMD